MLQTEEIPNALLRRSMGPRIDGRNLKEKHLSLGSISHTGFQANVHHPCFAINCRFNPLGCCSQHIIPAGDHASALLCMLHRESGFVGGAESITCRIGSVYVRMNRAGYSEHAHAYDQYCLPFLGLRRFIVKPAFSRVFGLVSPCLAVAGLKFKAQAGL